ncbi:MAG: PSD1 and planctomycete cytochrome C domain-containing protein [Planctomycetes bacterium]|nr:PSD1 and planctomycete cytochrome C domain-containing protein [Planctomycetota bacterium]
MSRFFLLTSLFIFSGTIARGAEPAVDFNRDIRPILSNNCYACHGPDEKVRKGKVRFDTRAGALSAIVPGKPEQSEIVRRILSTHDDEAMPPKKSGKKLTPAETNLIKAWIAQGADYALHWSYVKPVRPPVPKGANHPIDAFLRERLTKEGLKPSPLADRYTLIRRVSLDLTGLPPTWSEVEAFVNDQSADAYSKMVDGVLAKPAFGEHWGRLWLDLARYADSAGYADDPPRTIWPFRDYVIRSFNANKPFDQFTIEQIAGDMLPKPTPEQLTATAFHRNTMTNSEGGTNDEEFRNVAVVDRVNTTMAVWMGTSMACAQCHTHKYDPITQKEYFQFFAYLNNTEDADRKDETPLIDVNVDLAIKKARAELEKKTIEAEALAKGNPNDKKFKDEAAALRKQLTAMKPGPTVPIMKELADGKRRVTKLQFRGNFLDLGDTVTEGLPAVFPPLPNGVPNNRLGMAKWLVSRDNPLTARVVVNRFWEEIYGTGIVRTSEEFGSQGELPSHPALLDWLAVEFMEPTSGTPWDIKRLLKLMVMSEAYRQESRVTPEMREKDPDNRLYARGPRHRLSAEAIRDQALAVSGLLSTKMYGPSVRPLRPSMGLNAAFGGGLDWQPSDGENRHRRGLYTEWRRTSPYPSMATFDAPSREACTLRRSRTNTPLQALVTLNDPVYIEAAQALARKTATNGSTPTEKLAFAFKTALGRPITPREQERLLPLFDETKAVFAKDVKKATDLATNPIGPLPKGADAAELAAWTTVCNVLLNLDEMMMRR